MGLIAFLLLVLLVGVLGFWDTVGAILGGIGVIIVLILLGAGFIAAMAALLLRRARD